MNKYLLLSNNNMHEEYAFKTLLPHIKPGMKVLAFAYASDFQWQVANEEDLINGKGKREMYAPFKEFGIEWGDFIVAPIPRDNKSRRYIEYKIEKADIIFFRGGFMENIDFILKTSGLWDLLAKQDNKLFIGVSAGAYIMEELYQITPFIEKEYDTYERVKGLGLVKDYSVLVHYCPEKLTHHLNLLVATLLNRKKKVFALGEDGGLLIINNKHKTLGKVYKVF